MASQPPLQFNQMQPAIPNTAGISQPPRLQRPSTASNGIGQPTAGSSFPLLSTTNYAPVPALSNTASSQWARPPISGQSVPTPISQSSFTTTSHQQCNPAVPGQFSSRPMLQPLNSARPSNAFAMNQQSSGN